MKVDVSSPTPVKRTLAIEVEPQEVARETQAVLRGYAQKARIPGFRPGKAPIAVIRSRFGKEVAEDVRERVMTRCFREAAKEQGLEPLGDPVVDEVGRQEEGEPFRFRVSFEVLPAIDPQNYRGVEVRRPLVEVGEADVDQALEELREARTQLVSREGRAAATGDVLVVDLSGTPDEGEAFRREGMLLEVGATHNPPAFNEKLEGAEAGARLDFSVDYPQEFDTPQLAGRSVRYEVTVHEVKQREVPQLDDEFAKDLGEFENLAQLRERVRKDIVARREQEAERQLRQAVLDKVLLDNPIVLPETLVEEEVRHRLEEVVRRMMMQGIDPEKVELDWKELRDQQHEPARKAVHARLVLDAVARRESIVVAADEVDERIRRDAAAMGERHETVRKRLRQRGAIEVLRTQMVREKSLDLLTSVANIQTGE